MFAASAEDTLQHNLHAFFSFFLPISLFSAFWHEANIWKVFYYPKTFLRAVCWLKISCEPVENEGIAAVKGVLRAGFNKWDRLFGGLY